MDPLDEVFAYRAFDLRDRFPQPFYTLRQALEALQSEDAYLPEYSGSIIAYLKNGGSIRIPESFFIVEQKRFQTRDEAEAWVREREHNITRGQATRLQGAMIANADDPVEKQIEDAYASTESSLIPADRNEAICEAVSVWLRQAMGALPSKVDQGNAHPLHGDELTEWESSPPVGRELGSPDNPWD